MRGDVNSRSFAAAIFVPYDPLRVHILVLLCGQSLGGLEGGVELV